MKKIILAAALMSLPTFASSTTPAPAASGSNFDGFRATIGGSYLTAFSDAAITLKSGKDAADKSNDLNVLLDNGMSKFSLDLGYNKAVSEKFVIGGSVFGGYDIYRLTKDSKVSFLVDGKADTALTTSAQADWKNGNSSAGIDWFGGLKLSAGMTVTPNVLIKVIGEGTFERYRAGTADADAFAYGWNFGGAVGAGVDFAATDRIIIGLGAKYVIPADIKVNKGKDKDGNTIDLTETTLKRTGHCVELFAELAYRITQN